MRPGLLLGVIVALLAIGVIAVGFSGGDRPQDPPPSAGASASADGKPQDAKTSDGKPSDGQQEGKQEASGPVQQQQAAPASGGSNFWMWYGLSRMAGDVFDGFRGRQNPPPPAYGGYGAQDSRYAPPPPAANDNRAEPRSRFGSSYSKTPAAPAPSESVGRSRFNSNYGKRSSGGGFRMRRR